MNDDIITLLYIYSIILAVDRRPTASRHYNY